MKRLIVLAWILFSVSAPSLGLMLYNGADRHQIALTFDDGPSFKYTGKVLDILEKNRIKATFFVVGTKVEQYPEIFERVVKDGNEIGNHTYYHSRITTLSDNILLEEIDMTSNVVRKMTGKRPVFFRPPFGSFTKSERKLVEKAGYMFVLWSVNADDFYHIGWGMRTPKSIVKRVLRGIKGGDIILAHDDSQQLVQALPVIIDVLKKEGYQFVTLSEMVNAGKLRAKK